MAVAQKKKKKKLRHGIKEGEARSILVFRKKLDHNGRFNINGPGLF